MNNASAQNKETVWSLVDAKKALFTALSDRVWACLKFAIPNTVPSLSTRRC
ncbi:UNVERIFIED_ORG: hypothetical protein M2402_002706 [Rahnella aquatilis]